MSEPVLVATDLGFAWPGGVAWQPWSACIQPGLTLLQGGDGAGKSTLIRLLAAELRPTQGQLALAGQMAWPDAEAYRSQVFWCDPEADTHQNWVAREYLDWQRQRHIGWNEDVLQAHLDELALLPHLDKPLYALSAGSRRKLRLAAAFSAGALLTLLDDPLAALDRRSVSHVLEVLALCQSLEDRAVVVAMHEWPAQWPQAVVIPVALYRG